MNFLNYSVPSGQLYDLPLGNKKAAQSYRQLFFDRNYYD